MKRSLPIFCLLVFTLSACASSGGSPQVFPTRTSAPAQAAPIQTAAPTQGQSIDVAPAQPDIVLDVQFGELARQYLEALTDFGSRTTYSGSGEEQAAEYIADTLAGFGYAVEIQPFTAVDEDDWTVDSANVVAVKEGDSPLEIVVGAHYDSEEDVEGADDNASGVAGLLEVAELISDVPTPYTIRFIAFGAEEAGLLGSQAYVDAMSDEEIENTIAMINLDSIIAGDIAYVYSDEGDAAELRDWMLGWAQSQGYDLQTIYNVDLTEEDGWGTSDYDAFKYVGIPFTYFEATNWTLGDQDGYIQVDPQYAEEGEIRHTDYDTLEWIDETFPGRIDEHFELFVATLYAALTEFSVP